MDKKWHVFGGPNAVKFVINRRKETLDKEKSKFQDSMIQSQEEFKENVENLKRMIRSFDQH